MRQRTFEAIAFIWTLLALFGAFCAGAVAASFVGVNAYVGAMVVMGAFVLLIVWAAARRPLPAEHDLMDDDPLDRARAAIKRLDDIKL